CGRDAGLDAAIAQVVGHRVGPLQRQLLVVVRRPQPVGVADQMDAFDADVLGMQLVGELVELGPAFCKHAGPVAAVELEQGIRLQRDFLLHHLRFRFRFFRRAPAVVDVIHGTGAQRQATAGHQQQPESLADIDHDVLPLLPAVLEADLGAVALAAGAAAALNLGRAAQRPLVAHVAVEIRRLTQRELAADADFGPGAAVMRLVLVAVELGDTAAAGEVVIDVGNTVEGVGAQHVVAIIPCQPRADAPAQAIAALAVDVVDVVVEAAEVDVLVQQLRLRLDQPVAVTQLPRAADFHRQAQAVAVLLLVVAAVVLVAVAQPRQVADQVDIGAVAAIPRAVAAEREHVGMAAADAVAVVVLVVEAVAAVAVAEHDAGVVVVAIAVAGYEQVRAQLQQEAARLVAEAVLALLLQPVAAQAAPERMRAVAVFGHFAVLAAALAAVVPGPRLALADALVQRAHLREAHFAVDARRFDIAGEGGFCLFLFFRIVRGSFFILGWLAL